MDVPIEWLKNFYWPLGIAAVTVIITRILNRRKDDAEILRLADEALADRMQILTTELDRDEKKISVLQQNMERAKSEIHDIQSELCQCEEKVKEYERRLFSDEVLEKMVIRLTARIRELVSKNESPDH